MTLSQIIMAAVTAAITFLGVVLSQIGKRGDQQIQRNEDQFKRLLDETNYWKKNADEARHDLESFRERQSARCRKMTEAAAQTIAELMRFVPPAQHRRGDRTLGEIDTHNEMDHS